MHNRLIKILLLLFLILSFFGCDTTAAPDISIPIPNFDTEVNCPYNNYHTILLETTPDDIRKAIDFAIKERNKYKTTENYTVLKLPYRRNFFIQNITPEQMQFCYLTAIPVKRN